MLKPRKIDSTIMTWSRASRIFVELGVAVTCLLAAVLAWGVTANAQQLSVRRYGMREGLASNRVAAILQDSKGYLWFGTWDGLSRYDGYRFTNYGLRDGLEQPFINSVIEDRRGRIWVSTWGSGVALLADGASEHSALAQRESPTDQRKKFVTYRVGQTRVGNEVSALLLGPDDGLWAVTAEGVYRAPSSEMGAPQFELVFPEKIEVSLVDKQGRIWFLSQKELIEVAQGRVIRRALPAGLLRFPVASIVEGFDQRLLIADSVSVFEFTPPINARLSSMNEKATAITFRETAEKSAGEWKKLPLSIAADDRIRTALMDAQGTLWLGTARKLVKYREGRQTDYANSQLSNNAPLVVLHQDREGNLWIGTAEGNTGTGLICKFPGEMIVSYTEAHGLPTAYVTKVVESSEGRIYASTIKGFVEIVDGKVVPVPGSQVAPFNDAGKRFFQDARGDWWVGTAVGLYRFTGPQLQFRQGKKFTDADGIPEIQVFAGPGMYEDAQGKIWVSTGDDLYVYDPKREGRTTFERIRLKDIAPGIISAVLTMHSDASGALWLGSYGGLGRMSNGRIEAFQTSEGLPDLQARAFYQDSRGRLWIGLRYKGVSVTDEPTTLTPKFKNYSTASGLSSDAVGSIIEDDFGFIYLGGRGLNQLDPATGRIRQFTTADGLAGDEIMNCYKDRHGNIWVAALGGLSKLNLRVEQDLERHPPPIYLSRIQVAGEDLPLSETGALRLPALALSASQNNLSIEYIALSFRAGRQLLYQYKFEGMDADWSAPTEQRALNFARLAPGTYRFLVRAVDQYGLTSPEPAMLEFRIAPPIWQRWWFVVSVLALVGMAAFALYRYRVARLVELERVRTRIATDLHDDIGSNLSRIAILSEVATRQITTGDERVKEPLSKIAATSRELVDSMSDIVWAINPAKDQLSDLTQRMRRFASDVFTSRDIEFNFRAPSAELSVGVGVEVRREVFLIFKEAVNNAVRHAACTEVDIELQIEGGRLLLTLRENGKGFDTEQVSGGHGLASMRARAASIGGSLDIATNGGTGTTVILRVPLVAVVKRGPSRVR